MSNNIKLIASDLDGTLLNEDKTIASENLEAIKKAREQGVLFTIATGRPLPSTKRYYEITGADVPMILYNGALIYDGKTGKTISSVCLEPDDAIKILELADELGASACVWYDHKLYANKIDENVNEYKSLSGLEPIVIKDKKALAQKGIIKILIHDTPQNLQNFVEKIRDVSFNNVTTCFSGKEYFEFFNKEVSKGVGLLRLCEYCGIKPQEVLALGDAENDKPMLKAAGIGVAMANGFPETKAAADYITDDNESGGWAKAVNKFIFNK